MRLRRLPLAALTAALCLCAGRLAAQAAPTVRLGARVFSELEVVPSDSGASAQFNLTRAYFMGLGTLRPGLSGHVTLDVYREDGGSLGYRLKHAYVEWQPQGGDQNTESTVKVTLHIQGKPGTDVNPAAES